MCHEAEGGHLIRSWSGSSEFSSLLLNLYSGFQTSTHSWRTTKSSIKDISVPLPHLNFVYIYSFDIPVHSAQRKIQRSRMVIHGCLKFCIFDHILDWIRRCYCFTWIISHPLFSSIYYRSIALRSFVLLYSSEFDKTLWDRINLLPIILAIYSLHGSPSHHKTLYSNVRPNNITTIQENFWIWHWRRGKIWQKGWSFCSLHPWRIRKQFIDSKYFCPKIENETLVHQNC